MKFSKKGLLMAAFCTLTVCFTGQLLATTIYLNNNTKYHFSGLALKRVNNLFSKHIFITLYPKNQGKDYYKLHIVKSGKYEVTGSLSFFTDGIVASWHRKRFAEVKLNANSKFLKTSSPGAVAIIQRCTANTDMPPKLTCQVVWAQ